MLRLDFLTGIALMKGDFSLLILKLHQVELAARPYACLRFAGTADAEGDLASVDHRHVFAVEWNSRAGK